MKKTNLARVLGTLFAVLTSVGMWAQTPLLTSGKCSWNSDSNATVWSFDESTNTLTISPEDGNSASGIRSYYEEYGYEEYDGWVSEEPPAPWRKYIDYEGNLHNGPDELIQHIVVEDGVRSIGAYAFYGLVNLETVTLASTVTSIGRYSMQNDPSLTSVIILCPKMLDYYDEPFYENNLLTLYVIQQQVGNYTNSYSDINVEGFLLKGNGYKATVNEASRELLDVKNGYYGHNYCTLTLNGDHTATINGKDYTIKGGTEIWPSAYNGVIKEDTQEAMRYEEVTETGEYRYDLHVGDMFTDEANENTPSELFTVTNTPTEGEGWAFDFDNETLTISGNVTDEPWKPFAGFIQHVYVEEGVTQLPADAFSENNAYNLYEVILRSTTMVNLNGAFTRTTAVWDEEHGEYIGKDYLAYDIYVPSSLLDTYQTTYADLLSIEDESKSFLPSDISVTLPASGVMAFSASANLDFTHCEGLKAYVASEFVPSTGKLLMEPVTQMSYYEGMVLKGTPGATYIIEKSWSSNWVHNQLKADTGDIDPSLNPYYVYLKLEGTEFKPFTTTTNVKGQAYLQIENETYEGAKKPITMLFTDEEALTEGDIYYDDCHWSYDADTKTLTISGENTRTGDFAKEYVPGSSQNVAPWRTYTTSAGVKHLGVEDGIEHIVVKEGVTDIGEYAFYGLKNLEDVTLASSVENLDFGALQGCPKLKTVVSLYRYGIYMRTGADTYSVANVGETYYVPNSRKEYVTNMLADFDNVKVEGFDLTGGTLKVDFTENPLTWDTDHFTGEIHMLNHTEYNLYVEGAKTTINGVDYPYENGITLSYADIRYRKDNQDPDLWGSEVTQPGNYYVKATVPGLFNDEAKNTAISEHYVEVYVADTEGEGWAFDFDNNTLTISGDVTGEPWEVFKHDIYTVVVEEDVTQLPENAFRGYRIARALIKGADVNLNKAFLGTDYVYDDEVYDYVQKDVLATDLYVPAASLASYNEAYASYLVADGGEILSFEVSIDITDASEGVIAYCNNYNLDLSDCEGLQAYAITDFNPATGALTLQPATKLGSGSGFLLMGKTGTYTAKLTFENVYYYNNMLDGWSYVEPEEDYGTVIYINLTLEGSGAARGFYPITEEGNLPDYVAHMSVNKDDFEAWKALGHDMIPLKFEVATDINDIEVAPAPADDAWYTLNGMKLESKPTEKGVYIYNGKKYVIK